MSIASTKTDIRFGIWRDTDGEEFCFRFFFLLFWFFWYAFPTNKTLILGYFGVRALYVVQELQAT